MEKKLEALLKNPVHLTITDNRRSIISARWTGDAYRVRLHHMFLEADEVILLALAQYISHQPEIAVKEIDAFINEHKGQIRKSPDLLIKRKIDILPRGECHDLQAIFDFLNREYFDKQINCHITWGNRRRLKGQKSIRLGSYSYWTKTIRIHPALDKAYVPDYVLHDIVYHEMLHAFLGVEKRNGRNHSHHPQFRKLEKRHINRRLAEKWIEHNLDCLISPVPGRRRRPS